MSLFLLHHSDGLNLKASVLSALHQQFRLLLLVQRCNSVVIASCPFGDPEYEFTTVSDHVHPLWPQWNHLLIAASSRTMLHVIKLKSSQTGFANWHWVRCRQMASTVTRSNLPTEHLWNVLECCWFQRAEKNSQTSSSWGEGNRNSNNYSLQSSYAQDTLVLTLLKFKVDGLQHQVPLPLAKIRKLRLKIAQAH